MSQLRRTQCRIAWFGNRSFWHFACCCVTASTREPAVCFFSLFPFFCSLHNALQTRIWCTFSLDLFSTFHSANCFTQTHAVGDPLSGTVFKTSETEGERAKEGRGRRAIWIGVWSIFKRFSRVLTWSDQKHPTGTGPCSHKGRPLMLLPWLPCWPSSPPPPCFLPVYAWIGAVTLSLYIKTKPPFWFYFFFIFFGRMMDYITQGCIQKGKFVTPSCIHATTTCIYKQVFTQEIILQCIFFLNLHTTAERRWWNMASVFTSKDRHLGNIQLECVWASMT